MEQPRLIPIQQAFVKTRLSGLKSSRSFLRQQAILLRPVPRLLRGDTPPILEWLFRRYEELKKK